MADEAEKTFADTARIGSGETWSESHGHSGTRRAWFVSLALVASVALAGCGLTFAPRFLLWVGVGCAAALGVYSLAARVWSDYE